MGRILLNPVHMCIDTMSPIEYSSRLGVVGLQFPLIQASKDTEKMLSPDLLIFILLLLSSFSINPVSLVFLSFVGSLVPSEHSSLPSPSLLWKEGFILAHSLRVRSTMTRELQRQDHDAAGRTVISFPFPLIHPSTPNP